MDKILLSSKPIEISEFKTYKEATFLISVLDEWDLNNRFIPKDVGEKYHKTIIGFPIVAKLIRDADGNPIDFRGHEMKVIQDEYGNTDYRLDTFPIGSVLDSWIEKREVSGYEGIKDCIMIKCKLWSDRFPEYFKVLDKLWAENNVKSSWELVVEQSQKTIRGKIIKAFSFLGNALLGSSIEGAVPGAGAYEYAQNLNDNFDNSELILASALSSDCNKISDIKTEAKEDNMAKTQEIAEEEVIETPVEASENIVEETTPIANEEIVDENSDSEDNEKDNAENTDVVEAEKNNEISEVEKLREEIAAKNEALLKANEEIQALKSDNEMLVSFKERCDREDAEKAETELSAKKEVLKQYALNSKQISEKELETEEFMTIISELNESKLKEIVADRFVASLTKTDNAKIEVSEIKETPKANLESNEDVTLDAVSIVKSFLKK